MAVTPQGMAGKDRIVEIAGYSTLRYSSRQIARRTEKSVAHVNNVLRIIRKSPALARKVAEGEIAIREALKRVGKAS